MIEHRFSEEIFLKEVTFRGIPTINYAARLPVSNSSRIILMDFGLSLTDLNEIALFRETSGPKKTEITHQY